MRRIHPFCVIEVLEEAFRLESEGQDIIHLQTGEADFDMPEPITHARIRTLQEKCMHYIQALAISELRELIANHYPVECHPPVHRVAVTPGSSADLQLVFACFLGPGDRVLLADPGYPCNSNFVHLYGGIRFVLSVVL